MQMVVGYKLIETATQAEITSWGGTWGQCPGVPNPIMLPNGLHVHAPSVGVDYDGCMLVEWLMDEPPPPVPATITRRQCALQLLTIGMITGPEAVEMTRSGLPPASVQAAFDQMPEPNRTMVLIDFAAANYYRASPLIPSLVASAGMTEADVDAFFIAAAAY